MVIAHARALLTGNPAGNTDYIDGDVNDPGSILGIAREKLDFTQHVAIMLMGMPGHVGDPAEDDDAYTQSIVATLRAALPSGGYLALNEALDTDQDANEALDDYNRSGAVPYRARLPAPGRTWQVPAGWVDRTPPWRRSLVWGSPLGPGLATRNPYAGFGLLPLAVAAVGNPGTGVVLAAAIGLLHATGRVLGLVRDLRVVASADYLQSVMRSLRWRRLDGFALLFFTGLAAMTIALRC